MALAEEQQSEIKALIEAEVARQLKPLQEQIKALQAGKMGKNDIVDEMRRRGMPG